MRVLNYLDAGTVSVIMAAIAAVVAGLVVFIKMYWHRVRRPLIIMGVGFTAGVLVFWALLGICFLLGQTYAESGFFCFAMALVVMFATMVAAEQKVPSRRSFTPINELSR